METILVIFFLSVQSSYAQNKELPATANVFDTIQFVADNGKYWRIKTYALDQDVHIWSLGSDVADIEAVAKANTMKHYGDLLTEGYVIKTGDGVAGVRRALHDRGLDEHLELPEAGGLFWAPSGSRYRSKSTPE